MNKKLIVVLATLLSTQLVWANTVCDTQAADKKLAGAAKNSFLKKCETDASKAAQTSCNSQAADKKLAGAAKNSFVKKCVKDAAATQPAAQ